MSLPDRQQQILDQIEQALQSADPALKSMYAMFGQLTSPEAMPAIEAMPAGEGAGEAEATAAAAGTMGKTAVTGAAGESAPVTGTAGESAGAPAARKSAGSWMAVGTVGPMASQAGVASTGASRRRVRRTLVILVIVLGLLGLLIFNMVSTSSQCPGLSSDQVVASAAVRYAACNHSTDAWSKGAR